MSCAVWPCNVDIVHFWLAIVVINSECCSFSSFVSELREFSNVRHWLRVSAIDTASGFAFRVSKLRFSKSSWSSSDQRSRILSGLVFGYRGSVILAARAAVQSFVEIALAAPKSRVTCQWYMIRDAVQVFNTVRSSPPVWKAGIDTINKWAMSASVWLEASLPSASSLGTLMSESRSL